MAIEISKKVDLEPEIKVASQKINYGLAQSSSCTVVEIEIYKKILFGGVKKIKKQFECELVFSSITRLEREQLEKEIAKAWVKFYKELYENSKKKLHRIIDKDVIIMSKILKGKIEVIDADRKEIEVVEDQVTV